MSEAVGSFPTARLPGVVRQNMADFRSNPLGWDTVQLSPRVCSTEKGGKTHKGAYNAVVQAEFSVEVQPGVCRFVFRKATVAVERAETERVPALPLLLPRCQSSFPRFSSCLFITKAVHFSTGWVTSASRRLTGEGGVSRQTNVKPRQYLHPNLWNGCL